MKHVHSEVIKAWADDTSIQIELDTGSGWRPATAQPSFWEHCNVRIKPQPKAISFHNVYDSGVIGSFKHASRAAADERAIADNIQKQRIAVVEVRDDGTAHLHKVEA